MPDRASAPPRQPRTVLGDLETIADGAERFAEADDR
jgi:hypothetical protein